MRSKLGRTYLHREPHSPKENSDRRATLKKADRRGPICEANWEEPYRKCRLFTVGIFFFCQMSYNIDYEWQQHQI